MRAVIPAIASKQYGSEDVLAALVAEAALSVMPENPKTFNVDNVRVVKIMGGSLAGSRVVQGMVFGREPEGKYPLSPCCGWTKHPHLILVRRHKEGHKSEGRSLHESH